TSSALEFWLESSRPDKTMLERARRLRERLVQLRISKYNIGPAFTLAPAAKNKRVILVPGQVEEDASVQYGSTEIRTNLALLKTVRRANPDAFIVFKPHPDLVAGNRPGVVLFPQLNNLCDQVVIDADIIDCIQKADEVHTMTSLSGFEALLHGKQVYCYGLPFYAGWGLTHDRLSVSRRTRRLSLDELVYGALIHYPRYIRPDTLTSTSPENVVEILQQAHLNTKTRARTNLVTKQWGKFIELSKVFIFRRGYEQ
ncbi:MAG TPA: capsular polysaccharide biosynthesis protein, partial [Gammaproteobacteria bacterium]